MTAIAPSAEALVTTGTLAGFSTGSPEVYRDTADNPAGDLTVQAMTDEDPVDGTLDTVQPTTLFPGEQLILVVSDGGEDNCDVSGQRIGFSHAPTVTFINSTN